MTVQSSPNPAEQISTPGLGKALASRHVAMISIGGIIGAGLFVGSSAAIDQVATIGRALEDEVVASAAIDGVVAGPAEAQVRVARARVGHQRAQLLVVDRPAVGQRRLLLLDEPSMGLSPIMVDKIFEVIAEVAGLGVTLLLVEQNASRALKMAQRAYVMESGEISMQGEAKALLHDPKVRAAYLGE